MRDSHDHGGGDRGKIEEHSIHPTNHDTYKSDGEKFGRRSDIERNTDPTKRNCCYRCGGTHDYAKCHELKSLGVVSRE